MNYNSLVNNSDHSVIAINYEWLIRTVKQELKWAENGLVSLGYEVYYAYFLGRLRLRIRIGFQLPNKIVSMDLSRFLFRVNLIPDAKKYFDNRRVELVKSDFNYEVSDDRILELSFASKFEVGLLFKFQCRFTPLTPIPYNLLSKLSNEPIKNDSVEKVLPALVPYAILEVPESSKPTIQKDRKGRIIKLKPRPLDNLEKGKWYYQPETRALLKIKNITESDIQYFVRYHKDILGKWVLEGRRPLKFHTIQNVLFLKRLVPAQSNTIKAALVSRAKTLDLKLGITIATSSKLGQAIKIIPKEGNGFRYYKGSDTLTLNNVGIYNNGKWVKSMSKRRN